MLGERYLLPCPHLADLGRGWLVLKGKDKGDGGKQLASQQEKGKKNRWEELWEGRGWCPPQPGSSDNGSCPSIPVTALSPYM